MRPWILGAFAACLVALPAPAGDQEAVEQAFYSYKSAIMNGRGSEGAALLSASTFRYYEQMRDLALYAPEETLRAESTINLMMALFLRHRVATETLRGQSGQQIVVHAIEQGWIGKNSVAPFEVQAVHVVEGTAVVDVVSSRVAGTAQFRFEKEAAGWKLDLTPLMREASLQFDNLARQQGQSRIDLILSLLSALSGKQADASVWQAPLTRE